MNLKEEYLKNDIVKKGEFVLKSGERSDTYFDLRSLISFPAIQQETAIKLSELVRELKPDLVAGLAYASIPVTSLVSVELGLPMIYRRKEKKEYGTGKELEGSYKKGQAVVLIDDVMTSGGSKLEVIEFLEGLRLEVIGIVVIVNRSNVSMLNNKYPVCPLYNMEEF